MLKQLSPAPFGAALMLAVFAAPTESSALFDHGWFRGWFGHGQTCCSPVAPSVGTQCCPQTVRYVPQTCCRNVCVNVPVTTYQPVQCCDPCTGCLRTTYRPVTRMVQQQRQVQYTTYRAVSGSSGGHCCNWLGGLFGHGCSRPTYYNASYGSTGCCQNACYSPTSSCGTGCGTTCGSACGSACGTSTSFSSSGSSCCGTGSTLSSPTITSPSTSTPTIVPSTPSTNPATPQPQIESGGESSGQPRTFQRPVDERANGSNGSPQMRPVPDAENTGVQFPEAPEWQPPQRTARAPLVRQAVFSAENNMTQAQRDAQGWRAAQ